MTVRITINPPWKRSKAGIVVKARFPGSIRTCCLDSKLGTDKGSAAWDSNLQGRDTSPK